MQGILSLEDKVTILDKATGELDMIISDLENIANPPSRDEFTQLQLDIHKTVLALIRAAVLDMRGSLDDISLDITSIFRTLDTSQD